MFLCAKFFSDLLDVGFFQMPAKCTCNFIQVLSGCGFGDNNDLWLIHEVSEGYLDGCLAIFLG